MKTTTDERAAKTSVDDLVPYAKNAKLHSKEQVIAIAESIKTFGFTNPVLIDEKGEIIAGHGRVLAARELGLKEVPTRKLEGMSEEKKRAYRIADNRIGEIGGGWDAVLLKQEHEELKALIDFEFGITGWNESDLASMEMNDGEDSDFRYPIQDGEFVPKDSSIQSIILIYPVEEFRNVVKALDDYAEKFGLANNAEVVQHLLETNGYAISVRKP